MDQPQVNDQIKSAIKAKLKELGTYVDDELPDYILVMVANKKSMTQMEVDLEIFLHSRAKEFTKWLFAVLEKLNRVSKVKKRKGSNDAKDKKEQKKKPKKIVDAAEVILPVAKNGLDEEALKAKTEVKKKDIAKKEGKEKTLPSKDVQPKEQVQEVTPTEDNFENEKSKADPIINETPKSKIEENPTRVSRSTSRRLSRSRDRSKRRSRSSNSSRSGSREKLRKRRSESSSSKSSRSRSSSRYNRIGRRRTPVRLARRSRSPLPRRGNRDIRGRNNFGRRRSRSPYLPSRSRDTRESRTTGTRRSPLRRSPPRRSPPRRNRHRSFTPELSIDQPKKPVLVSSIVSVVRSGDSEYNPLGLLKQSIQGANTVTKEMPVTSASLKSKKKAVPNPVKIASLVLQAAQEADKSIKKMSEREKNREAIIEKIQARAIAEDHRKPGAIGNSSRVSDIRQRIGPRTSTSIEFEKREPRQNFLIEIRNPHLEESDLRQRLSNRPSKLTRINSTHQEETHSNQRGDQNLKKKLVHQKDDDDLEGLEEMRRRALASMLHRKEASVANSNSRKSMEQKEPSADSSCSSDDSSSDSSDTDSSSSESSDSQLPKAKDEAKAPFEPTFVVTLDGIDESYFEKRKKSGQSTNQLNLLKAKYNDNPMQMGRGIEEPIIIKHSKGISVPILEAVGGGGGVQDPKSLEMMYKLSNQSKRAPIEKPQTSSITTENIKKEKSDAVTSGANKRVKESVNVSPRSSTQKPTSVSPSKRLAPKAEVKTASVEKNKRPRIEAPTSSPNPSLLKPFKAPFQHERKERALSPVAPTQSICRYWPNCTRGFQCLFYHPKVAKQAPRPSVPSDRYRWRAEQTRV